MPNDAVKITYGATTVLFQSDEVLETVLSEKQDYQLHQKQSLTPAAKYIESTVEALEVVFDLQRLGTATKIEQFMDAAVELTVYPAMGYDSTDHLHCVPLCDGQEEIETFGFVEAVSRRVQFIQTSS